MKKVLVHLHLYYYEQADYFIEKLANINGCEWDLVLTYTEEHTEILKKFTELNPNTKFIKMKNKGYDIYPFLEVLRTCNPKDYDYILKLHTKCQRENNSFKANGKSFYGYNWRNLLVDTLLKSKKVFAENLKILDNKKIGMIYPSELEFPFTYKFPEECSAFEEIAKQLKLSTKYRKYLAGTMFMAKSDIFDILINSEISEKDFKGTPKTGEIGTISHILERVLSILPIECGYKIHAKGEIKLFFRMLPKKINDFIISIGNDYDECIKHKYLMILGIKLPIRNRN